MRASHMLLPHFGQFGVAMVLGVETNCDGCICASLPFRVGALLAQGKRGWLGYKTHNPHSLPAAELDHIRFTVQIL
jgi:hypothetical protein